MSNNRKLRASTTDQINLQLFNYEDSSSYSTPSDVQGTIVEKLHSLKLSHLMCKHSSLPEKIRSSFSKLFTAILNIS